MEYMKKRKCVKKSERSRFSNAFLTFFQEKVRAGYKTLRHIGENASCQLAKTEKRAKLDVFAFRETHTGQPETGRNNLKKPFFFGFYLTCDSQVGSEKLRAFLDFGWWV